MSDGNEESEPKRLFKRASEEAEKEGLGEAGAKFEKMNEAFDNQKSKDGEDRERTVVTNRA